MATAYVPRVQGIDLPITNGVYRNVDGEALSDYNYQTYDAYLNELKWHVKRPGLGMMGDLGLGTGYPITGMYWWPIRKIMIAVAGGHVFKLEYTGGVIVVTDLGGSTLTNGVTNVFATDGTYVFIVSGGAIYYTDGTNPVQVMADGDAPTNVTHIDWIDGYLIATNSNNRFYYCDLNASTSWTASSFFSATGNPDNIVALTVFQRQMLLLGEITTEVWENVGSTPSIFKRAGAGFFQHGCIAPYSLVTTKDAAYWLSDERRFVKFSGGNVEPISTPYDAELDEMSSVSDCVGNYIHPNGVPFLIFHFQSANRTLVLNLLNNTWSEWSYWNTSTASRSKFLPSYCCYSPSWHLTLCGSGTGTALYSLSRDYHDDNGTVIDMSVVSGHVNHGNLRRKRSNYLEFNAISGAGGTTTPQFQIRWKNDNGNWSNWRNVSLGDIGQTKLPKCIYNLGIYRVRQWEFRLTEPIRFAFGAVQEYVEVIDQ